MDHHRLVFIAQKLWCLNTPWIIFYVQPRQRLYILLVQPFWSLSLLQASPHSVCPYPHFYRSNLRCSGWGQVWRHTVQCSAGGGCCHYCIYSYRSHTHARWSVCQTTPSAMEISAVCYNTLCSSADIHALSGSYPGNAVVCVLYCRCIW